MTSHIATLLRPLARSILFSRPKQSSKERQRDKQRETTAKLRRELAEDKRRQLHAHLEAYRAVEQAICGRTQ